MEGESRQRPSPTYLLSLRADADAFYGSQSFWDISVCKSRPTRNGDKGQLVQLTGGGRGMAVGTGWSEPSQDKMINNNEWDVQAPHDCPLQCLSGVAPTMMTTRLAQRSHSRPRGRSVSPILGASRRMDMTRKKCELHASESRNTARRSRRRRR